MVGKNGNHLRVLTNKLAYVSLIVSTILLAISKIARSDNNAMQIIEIVANILLFVVVALASFWFAYSKRSAVYKVLWFVFTIGYIVLVVVL